MKKTPARSCRTKRAYPSLLSAQVSAKKCNAKGVRVKPYQCSVCSKWHMQSRDKASILTDLFKQISNERLLKS